MLRECVESAFFLAFRDDFLRESADLFDAVLCSSGMSVKQVCGDGQTVNNGVQVEYRADFSPTAS
jgi:hypothetical protein